MITSRIKNLSPYIPGEQPQIKNTKYFIKLNANENPYPPSPSVSHILQNISQDCFAKYPDPESLVLRQSIAQMLNDCHGVLSQTKDNSSDFPVITQEMIFCGNGSDEVLSFIFNSFFEGPEPLIIPEFTYSFYPVYAGYYTIPLKTIPLNSDFTININAFIKEKSCGIIFANPNAPTGIMLEKKELISLLEHYPKDKVIVIDEAYIDFGGETAIPLLSTYKNLIIVRTFSKSMSFAGMRLGFVVASPEIINTLIRVKNSFNHFPVDVLCQQTASAACKDIQYYRNNCISIIKTREWFSKELQKRGWYVLPSTTNFIFTKHASLKGHMIYEKLKEHGIFIRYFDIDGIKDFVRISIGTQEQMKIVLDIINTF